MNRQNPLLRIGAIVATGALLWASFPTMPAEAAYAGSNDHYAGSQIAAIEGIQGLLDTARDSPEDQVLGHDVSGHQGEVDWPATADNGAKFVYVKATEGTGFVNPRFAQQYNGSYDVGMTRGSYHFARPDISGGAQQANYFVDHGGGWSGDGRTLPGALDAEYNPYGETCYGLNTDAMTAWIREFSDTYRQRTGRPPTIYTSTNWWKRCTGNSAAFGESPLWLARYNTQIGELPASWTHQTIWQFSDKGALPGDQNYFNGGQDRLRALSQG